MWRILTATILSLALSFATPVLYHVYVSDFKEGLYSDHYNYSAEANDDKYYLVPAEYSEWFAFRDGVTENYGKQLLAKKGLVQLYGIARKYFLLKNGDSYYQLKPTNLYTYFELEKVQNPKVYAHLYLLRYFGIYLSLVIVPLALGYGVNRFVLIINVKWMRIIMLVSAILGTSIVGYVYLRDWWTLFNGWVLG